MALLETLSAPLDDAWVQEPTVRLRYDLRMWGMAALAITPLLFLIVAVIAAL